MASLVALDIAARVSTGATWPDEDRASSIDDRVQSDAAPAPLAPSSSPLAPSFLLNAEDDLADTIRSRHVAAGADLSKIIAVPSFLGSRHDEEVPREHQLRRDLARLGDLLTTIPDCRLIIIDPISAYLRGVNASGEVRRLIVPLAQLAEERQLAILAISHLRKQ